MVNKGEKAKKQVEAWREYKKEYPFKSTKEEQLRKSFKKILIEMLNETEDFLCHDFEDLAGEFTNKLIKEVTIRVKL